MEDRITRVIRDVLDAHARLDTEASNITPGEDLYAHGLTSLARVEVMLGLEAAFDVEFPNHLLRHTIFASIQSIAAAVRELTDEQ